MNKHRESIYKLRREILNAFEFKVESLKLKVLDYLRTQVGNMVNFHTASDSQDWNVSEISETFKAMTGMDLSSQLTEIAKTGNKDEMTEFIIKKTEELYESREKEIGIENMRRLEKLVLLRTIDELWIDHIDGMEYLRDSVRLRAYGQRDPLVEYKIEGQSMYNRLMMSIGAQVANLIFKVSFMEQPKVVHLEEKRPDIIGDIHKHQEVTNEPAHRTSGPEESKLGRNDPCWCNSGKKFKKCHGA